MDNPRLLEAIAYVHAACKEKGKMSFIYAANPEAARKDFEKGYDSVALGMDASVLVDAYRSLYRKVMD